MKKIILASQSPRRKELLQQLGLEFTVVPSDHDEKMNPRLKPRGQVEYLSKEKENYIKTKEPMDKAGAYSVQELGAIFIEKIEGDFFGAVGLPLFSLANELKHFGISVL